MQSSSGKRKQNPNKPKRVPIRTCIACRNPGDKRSLVRLVKTPAGVQIDTGGKQAGRGAYLHSRQDCWQKSLAAPNLIGRALKTQITDSDLAQMAQYAMEHIQNIQSEADNTSGIDNLPTVHADDGERIAGV